MYWVIRIWVHSIEMLTVGSIVLPDLQLHTCNNHNDEEPDVDPSWINTTREFAQYTALISEQAPAD